MEDAMDAFVAEELQAFAQYLLEQAKERLLRRNIVADRDLLNSLATQAAEKELRLWFADHGRMHDMGAGKGYEKGKFMGVEERGEILKGRTPSKWYSRMAWGSVYGTLVNNLANKYVQEVPGLITGAVELDSALTACEALAAALAAEVDRARRPAGAALADGGDQAYPTHNDRERGAVDTGMGHNLVAIQGGRWERHLLQYGRCGNARPMHHMGGVHGRKPASDSRRASMCRVRLVRGRTLKFDERTCLRYVPCFALETTRHHVDQRIHLSYLRRSVAGDVLQ